MFSPAKGDPVRAAILDAIRAKYPRPVVFQVYQMKVSGDWAWTSVTATVDGQPAYESESALVHQERGRWKVVGGVDGGAEESVADQEYRDLRRAFPQAPPGIFD